MSGRCFNPVSHEVVQSSAGTSRSRVFTHRALY
jgi:hypothetical protein